MQGLLGHQHPSTCKQPVASACRSKRGLLVCRASKQQASVTSVAAEVQQYAVPQQVVLQNTQPGQAPACKLDRNSGALERDEYGKFVQFFRQASPYIEGHRSRTFVVVIPGAISGLTQQRLQAHDEIAHQLTPRQLLLHAATAVLLARPQPVLQCQHRSNGGAAGNPPPALQQQQ
jgi:hypothetical protein